jgi:4-hydroxyphenylacetate 3-monooxygenase
VRIEAFIDQANGRRAEHFSVRRMYNFGSATRDPEVAVPHQQEVALAGVHIALTVPSPRIYPIATHALSTADQVMVHVPETSGEVEIVLVQTDRLYVGVGSDHTDRALERTSILWSKQACPNILAPVLWPWDEVKDRWDSCVLRSWVDGRLYQDVSVSAFLSPPDMLRVLHERVNDVPARDFVLFGGTFVSVDKHLGFGARWDFELDDPQGGRKIRHGYDVINILDEVREGFRVPVENPKPSGEKQA